MLAILIVLALLPVAATARTFDVAGPPLPPGKARITVAEPLGQPRRNELVQGGLPFAPGVYREGQPLAVVDERGAAVPTQLRPLCRYDDGSVRWALLQFPVTLSARQSRQFTLRPGAAAPPPRALTARQDAERIVIDTGRLRLEIPRVGGLLLGRVALDGKPLLPAGGEPTVSVTDLDGTVHTSAGQAADVFALEQAGPLVATVHIGGWLRGAPDKQWYRWESRLTTWAGATAVLGDHTLAVLGGPPDHPLRRISLVLQPALGKGLTAALAQETGVYEAAVRDQPLRLFQRAPKLLNPVQWQAKQEPRQVREWQWRLTQRDRELASGRRVPGWLTVRGALAGCGVAVRDFAPQANKALQAGPEGVGVDLWADDEEGECVNLTLGRGKSHEVRYEFFTPAEAARARASLAGFDRAPIPTVDPPYLCSTGVLWGISPTVTSPFPKFEQDMETCFEASVRHREETAEEWGFLHLGDQVWPGGYGAHGIMYAAQEYDPGHAAFIAYARTGDRKYYDVGCQWARHYMDIEIDPRDGNERFHGYSDNANTHDDHNTGLEPGHVICGQMCDYYFFTGNGRVYETLGKLRDRVLPLANNPRGVFRNCERALGWPLLSLMAMYEATGDARCLQAGRKIVDYLKLYAADPAAEMRNGTWWRCWMMDGSKPFMIATLGDGLARYHMLTGDDSIIPTVRVLLDWMRENCWDADTGSFVVEFNPCGGRTLGFWTNYDLTNAWPYAYGYLLTGRSEDFRVAYYTMLGQFEQSQRPSGYKWPMEDWKAYGKVGRHGFNYVAIAAALQREGKLAALTAGPRPAGTTILSLKAPPYQPPTGEPKLVLQADFDDGLRTAEGTEPTLHGAAHLGPGLRGQALDTREGYWSVPAPAGFGTRPGTVAFWVAQREDMNADSPSQRGLLHTAQGENTVDCISIVLNYNNLIPRQYEGHGWLVGMGIVKANWKADDWHHVALRWTAGRAELFVDGRAAWQSADWHLLGQPPARLYLGWRPGNWLARARFDELRVYDGWLGDGELARLATRP